MLSTLTVHNHEYKKIIIYTASLTRNQQSADQLTLPWLLWRRQLWSGWCRCLLGPWCHLLVHTEFHTDHRCSSEDTGPWSPQVKGHGTRYHKLYPARNKGRWHILLDMVFTEREKDDQSFNLYLKSSQKMLYDIFAYCS